ncbi:hypothetical protein J5U46_12080 [Micromonospora tulbaghiae]|uniref:DivIVA domain-containing protein n=1 Tax=Micromonospora tulbaghiae TaxID=479978 RepID=A0AAW4JFY1_9ACTN|nr:MULTISPECIES: hypothetical protein [Micromonospora]KAB1906850.1 hypothetical protein F8279_12805 [Micromonospora sp. AMSO1212t]MBO4140888.1 hypothetical protein [Micromonospora tulbaghiae]
MDLHRSRAGLVIGLVLLPFGLCTVLAGLAGSTLRLVGGLIVGGLVMLASVAGIVEAVRPFRFHISFEGLTVRTAELNRLLPWAEIEHLVLYQPPPVLSDKRMPSPLLLLVPAARSTLDLPLTHSSPLDDRPCMVLLEVHDVREKTDQVAGALARYGGSRFTDHRQLVRQRFDSAPLSIEARGYDRTAVDALVQKGREALRSEDFLLRLAAKAQVERALVELPLVAHGYDPVRVDAFLRDLSAALARFEEGEEEPG